MTNVRKLLGRLNPATARYDVGRGGIPELTPQDIAGAVGMVQDQFAREVFCAVWWPAGSALARSRLLTLLSLMHRAELARQWRASQIVRLDLHIAMEEIAARAAPTKVEYAERDRLREKFERERKRGWPSNAAVYPLLREAALAELCNPKHCRTCEGRGTVAEGELVKTCMQCDGSGRTPVSDRQRAEWIEVGEDAYRKSWRPVYEWTYAKLVDAESAAAFELSRTLGSAA